MEELNEKLINYFLNEVEKKNREIGRLKEDNKNYVEANLWLSKEVEGLRKTINNLKEDK